MTENAALKERVALSSVAVSAVLTLGKAAAGLTSGSLALLSEAAHNAIDTGATILTYFAVRQGNKPADDKHHYGHGKYESLSALFETGLLAGLALYVLFTAAARLREGGEAVESSWWVFGVLIVSIVADSGRYLTLSSVAKKTGSHALAADAMHFASDLIGSVLVLIGLIANHYGFVQGDALAAMGVALFIGYAGFRLGGETLGTLLDRAPDGLADQLRGEIVQVPGVVAVENIKLRPNGPKILGEVFIAVARSLPLERVAEIEAAVRAKISEVSPETEATVSSSPRALDDETLAERIVMIAARKKLPVHHIFVHHLGDRDCIAFDLEVEGSLPMAEAHAIATALENDIRDEIGPYIEVESHIEPLQAHKLIGHESDPATLQAITAALKEAAAGKAGVTDVHAVRARATAEGLVVNFHAHVCPALSVTATHEALEEIERALREKMPHLLRVVGHAEPVGEA
ncbi:cation diffusion facilitator family transporter [Rhodoblastus acidophilus]|uniref:Cation diffusion facilitator family transporter n=1 Tax=Rhodoblastus acidophilus TaxID=1074 RepID=A0A6N8DPE4_RHOAC|nr:cation-efflux pump [Rhodoblastus acidophilus]MCW2274091.1 cation diffusion facilitator family transporter [Rhodoblastus acidophilus]MTV30664.1 cation diffusion facilitator family transporter [Rhodoblastus acidophilus]